MAAHGAAMFSWDKAAGRFRARYRRLAKRKLTDEDGDALGSEAHVLMLGTGMA